MQKRILCFGDSNTWGYNPLGGRYDETTRWPMVLESLLGDGYRVIEEGFNGRTFCYEDPVEGGFKSGEKYLPPCLMTANPLDLVIVMLGTNDTKERFSLNAQAIAYNLIECARIIRSYALTDKGTAPKLLIVSPPLIGDFILDTLHGAYFGGASPEKTKGLAREYRRFAKLLRAEFFDAAQVCSPSKLDAVHLTAEGHKALGRALYEKIEPMLKEE